ncbi:MAG: molecular chaperone HtpG, partial [Oligoflexales bacterium]|nr:molecular chaperone HtpG [Oligoflexales bacterium]
FQAEVKELLDLMVHSLYSNREIFLRELISNASDALDKLRYEELANKELKTTDEERHIRIAADKEKKMLVVSDNGIGMTHDEIIENIGTIAHSGTKKFFERAKAIKAAPELIGQFGVGFYSAFMVSNKVIVHTQKVGTDMGTVWESTGDGSYTVEDAPRSEGHGTSVTLYLKEFKDDDSYQDFSDEWTLRSTVKKYSDYIAFPIKMKVSRSEPKKDEKGVVIKDETVNVIKDETLNSQKAIWLKNPSEVTKEEYEEFYKHIAMDWMAPLETIHFQAEGTNEFSALLYIPSTVPMDYNQRESKIGPSLYIKRVFITANCEDLMPIYMRFVKGVVDSSDLPLNISREILQKDRQILQIKKALVGKLLKHFKTMLEKNRETYEKFWNIFGSTLKEGICSDYSNKDKIEKVSLFHSNATDKLTTLEEYVGRMKPDQKDIYYITGESLNHISSSPYLEKLKQKGYEVLFLIDPVDEFVVRSMTEFGGKNLVSITQEKLEIDTDEEKKKRHDELKTKEEKFKSLLETIQKALDETVKEVKLSDRLIDSPVCLVSGTDDPSAYMEKLMESMGKKMPKTKRILEINPDHPIFDKMLAASAEKQKVWAEILYNQALLNEGSTIENPMKFTRQISDLMVDASL